MNKARLTRRCSRPAAGCGHGRTAQPCAAGLLSGRVVRRRRHAAWLRRVARLPLGLAAALALGGCADYSPIPPDWVVHRCAGSWVVAVGQPPPGCEHLNIQVMSVTPRQGEGFRSGVPYATGTVAWTGSASPAVFQIGTPNKPATPFIWVADSHADAAGQGFAFTIHVQGRTAAVAQTDPTHDRMFVECGDQPLGDNWFDRVVSYERK